MAAVLTNPEGTTHIVSLVSGSSTVNAFDAIELGQGLNTPTTSDTRASMTAKIAGSLLQKATGYPLINDADLRNDGRGVNTLTWKFVYPEGALEILASNLIVTNYAAGIPSSGEPVMVSANERLVKRVDQELTVFVNVATGTGAASVVAHVDDATPLPEQVSGWSDREALISGGPGSHQRSGTDVFTTAREGQPVPTLWFLRNPDGSPLTRADIAYATARVSVREGDNRWTFLYDLALEVDAVAFTAPQRQSRLWRSGGGYYGMWTFVPPGSHGSKQTRLEITLTLVRGGTRTITHEIDYRPVS